MVKYKLRHTLKMTLLYMIQIAHKKNVHSYKMHSCMHKICRREMNAFTSIVRTIDTQVYMN